MKNQKLRKFTFPVVTRVEMPELIIRVTDGWPLIKNLFKESFEPFQGTSIPIRIGKESGLLVGSANDLNYKPDPPHLMFYNNDAKNAITADFELIDSVRSSTLEDKEAILCMHLGFEQDILTTSPLAILLVNKSSGLAKTSYSIHD